MCCEGKKQKTNYIFSVTFFALQFDKKLTYFSSALCVGVGTVCVLLACQLLENVNEQHFAGLGEICKNDQVTKWD